MTTTKLKFTPTTDMPSYNGRSGVHEIDYNTDDVTRLMADYPNSFTFVKAEAVLSPSAKSKAKAEAKAKADEAAKTKLELETKAVGTPDSNK